MEGVWRVSGRCLEDVWRVSTGCLNGNLEHKGYVINEKINKTTGEHYNSKGHKVSDMRVTILEKIFSLDTAFRKEREKFHIMKMNTRYKGLNQVT